MSMSEFCDAFGHDGIHETIFHFLRKLAYEENLHRVVNVHGGDTFIATGEKAV